MAKQIEGVYERVFDCAKEEFLQKGFKDASLRTIAKNAGTSTSSIYTRFQDKEGLFDAIVSPVVDKMKHWFLTIQEDFHRIDPKTQEQMMYDYGEEGTEQMVDFIYDHFDIFQLLLICSYGTASQDFLNDLVEIEVEYTVKYLECIKNDALRNGRVSTQFLHIVTSAYYSGIFEVVLHNMEKEEARSYVRQLREFYYAGYETLTL